MDQMAAIFSECAEDIMRLQAWLVRHDPKKEQDKRICMLSEGDTFGDSFCVMGTPRCDV